MVQPAPPTSSPASTTAGAGSVRDLEDRAVADDD